MLPSKDAANDERGTVAKASDVSAKERERERRRQKKRDVRKALAAFRKFHSG